MKVLKSLILMIFVSTSLFSQRSRTCIYEYGDSLVSCESNFKNLFNAWIPENISNANDTKLLSFQFVEKISSDAQINQYVERLSNSDALTSSFRVWMDNNKNKTQLFRLDTLCSLYNKLLAEKKDEATAKSQFEELRKFYADKIRKSIQVGNSVYVIKIEVDGKRFDDFVFCDPETKKVTWDKLFLNVTL
jgi:hypothetical protein